MGILNDNYICAVDIGSSKLSACVAQIKKNSTISIFFETQNSKGIKQGVIVDSIGLVNVVTGLVNKLKEKSGIKIKFIYAGVSGLDIVTKRSRAIVPLAERGNKVITLSDIQKVNEQARVLGSSLEEEIIHMIPSGYSIDSKGNIMNPLGLYSHRLEADLYLISAKLSSIQSLSRVVDQSGYEIKGLFYSGLAGARAAMGDEFKEGLNIFCDIGRDAAELLLFRDGVLRDLEILPIGGDDLTSQLQENLKIPFDLAEDIKRSYGAIGDSEQINEAKEILVKKSNLYKPIKQKAVSEILTSKARLMCSQIKEAIEKKSSLYEVDNFIAAGRCMLLEGFIETLENTLNIPVKLARVNDKVLQPVMRENSDLSGQKYLAYLTCLGMLSLAMQGNRKGILSGQEPSKNPISKFLNRFKEVYQEYF